MNQIHFATIRSLAAKLFELQAGRRRLLPMEGLRGISAFLVFFVHFYALFGSRAQSQVHSTFLFMATLGHCGVDVFFALSGFIIYGLLLKDPRGGYLGFVRRRISRLYPTFAAIFLLYVFFSLALPSFSKLPTSFFPAVAYLASNFLMLPGIFPIIPMITVAWSLSYELFFYLTLPLVVRWLWIFAWPRTARVIFFLFLCGIHLALTSTGWSQHPRLVMFGCGIMLSETCHFRVGWVRFGDCAALAVFGCSLTLAGLKGQPVFTEYCGPILSHSSFQLGFLFASTYALGYFALAGGGLLSQSLSWDWLRWFGNISYSYYLTHGVVLHSLRILLDFLHMPARLSPLPFLTLSIASFVATVAVSSIVFLAIEKRFSFPARAANVETTPRLRVTLS